jgi:hypothetical protein
MHTQKKLLSFVAKEKCLLSVSSHAEGAVAGCAPLSKMLQKIRLQGWGPESW